MIRIGKAFPVFIETLEQINESQSEHYAAVAEAAARRAKADAMLEERNQNSPKQ